MRNLTARIILKETKNTATLARMTSSEKSVQLKGLSIVAIILLSAAITITLFFKEMSVTSLMGASPKYKPTYPAVPATDITQAPQCLENYDKKWIGCQKLSQ